VGGRGANIFGTYKKVMHAVHFNGNDEEEEKDEDF
jgi:hypothetical protein